MAGFYNLLRGLGKAARSKYDELGALALEEGDELLRNQDTGYFDLSRSMETPSMGGDQGLSRYEPSRGMPDSLGRIDAGRSKRLLDTTLEGMRKGAHGWYNTEPLYDEFTRVLGPVDGDYSFNRYMDFVGATSPREKVKQNIRRSSEVYRRDRQGEPIMGLLQPDEAGPPELNMPPGYGTLAHKNHVANIEDVAMMGGLDPIGKPKISSFAANLKGNYRPMTMDTHNRAMIFPEDIKNVYNKKKGQMEKRMPSPSKTEYGFLEDYQGELGSMLGLEPAQWQSALWTGGASETGVSDASNFMNAFDDAIMRTSEKYDITPREAAEAFIKGEIPLASIMGTMYDEEDEEEVGYA